MADEVDATNERQEWEIEAILKSRHSPHMDAVAIERSYMKEDELAEVECDSCDQPIGLERLKVLPSATKCIFCQEEEERLLRIGR